MGEYRGWLGIRRPAARSADGRGSDRTARSDPERRTGPRRPCWTRPATSCRTSPTPSGEEIAIRGLSRLAPDPRSPLWFEYREPGLFSLVVEEPPESLDDEEFVTDRGVRVVLAGGEDAGLLAGHAASHAGLREFQLALRAARLGTHVGLRPADVLAAGPRDGTAGPPDPHGQDRVAAVSRPSPVVRRSRLGQDDRSGLGAQRTGSPRAGPLGAGAGAPVADRTMAGRVAAQVLAGFRDPRRSQVPRTGHGRLVGIRSGDRLDAHRQTRTAPVGDPGPPLGPGDRGRSPSPAEPHDAAVEVRQRAAQAVHAAADGHARCRTTWTNCSTW